MANPSRNVIPIRQRAISESEAAYLCMMAARSRGAAFGWAISHDRWLGLRWREILRRIACEDEEQRRERA